MGEIKIVKAVAESEAGEEVFLDISGGLSIFNSLREGTFRRGCVQDFLNRIEEIADRFDQGSSNGSLTQEELSGMAEDIVVIREQLLRVLDEYESPGEYRQFPLILFGRKEYENPPTESIKEGIGRTHLVEKALKSMIRKEAQPPAPQQQQQGKGKKNADQKVEAFAPKSARGRIFEEHMDVIEQIKKEYNKACADDAPAVSIKTIENWRNRCAASVDILSTQIAELNRQAKAYPALYQRDLGAYSADVQLAIEQGNKLVQALDDLTKAEVKEA